jgi:predicted nucleic acid-binding Zn ribbon protein
MNKQAVSALFSQIDNLDNETVALEADLKAQLAELTDRKSALIEKIAAELGEVRRVSRNGKTLTILSRPINGKTRWILRGQNEPKAKETVEL